MPSPTNGINRVNTRSSYHISRSGCRTCKRRKVRCDESGPSCRNCTSTGRICDGVNDNKFVFVDTTSIEQHQPRKSRSNSPATALTPPRRQDELRSFHVFFKTAAPLFATGALDAPFWQVLVPAMSQHMPFAWNSTISIGLLYENPVYGIDKNLPLLSQLGPPQLQALRWYSRAVTQLSDNFGRSPDRMLLALLSCTLFLTFEFQQGNPIGAFNLFGHFQTLFRVCVSPEALARPASSMTEGLEAALIPFSSRHVLALAQLGVPSLFHYMDHATMSRSQSRSYLPIKPAKPDFESCRSELFSLLCRSYMIVRASNLTRHLPDERSRTLPLQNELLANLDDWHDRIKSFVNKDQTNQPADQPISAAYLLAYFHVARIQVATCHSLTETIYHDPDHINSFQQILHQARTILTTPHTTCEPFTNGISPPLYFVATRCRHPPGLRRTAISVLQTIPSSLGPTQQPTHWSIFPIVQIASAVVAFEEGPDSVSDLLSLSPMPPRTQIPSPPTPPPANRLIHHIQFITRPRPPSRGGGSGKRELALRFITYSDRFEMRSFVRGLVGEVAWGLGG